MRPPALSWQLLPEPDNNPMLKQRIITALALLAILLPALFAGQPEWFMAVALVLLCLAAWEWGQLNGYSKKASWLIALNCMVLCAAAWKAGLPYQATPMLWVLAGSAWVLLGIVLLRAGVAGWPGLHRWMRIAGGVLAMVLAWLAVAQARVMGINFLLSILTLVWAADVFAYFVGKAYGKRKLAPGISPGKSWEGVWGGMFGVLLLAAGWVWGDAHYQASVASLYTRLATQGWWLLLLACLFMSAMSVVGDLIESLVKRSAGAKDSSNLLPGHGGVLDRVDALLPTLPLAMMLASLMR
jgi:phosphatidate cytidylyltransferase